MIPADELAGMRAEINHLLPDTCTILSVTRTSNGSGGFTESMGTVSAGVACRLDFMSGSEAIVAQALTPLSRWELTVPTGTSITQTSRILIGGNTYNVLSVDTGKSWAGCMRAVLELRH
jgi:hypothetical protein